MGLFDRLFRQEKTDSQETLANKELTEVISEMDSIAAVSYTHLSLLDSIDYLDSCFSCPLYCWSKLSGC